MPAFTAAANPYETEAAGLQKQTSDIASRYEKRMSDLQKKQTAEINSLRRKQTSELAGVQHNNSSEVERLAPQFEKEIVETRNSSYLNGQVSARSSVQSQIDAKRQESRAKQDWNAPLYSLKK
jgi:hypothetical protein